MSGEMHETDGVIYSMAPMEGIGTCYYRRVHRRLFPEGISRYYTPFLSVYPNLAFKKRDLREIMPREGEAPEETALRRLLVPQIMAKTAPEIVWAARKLKTLGFGEINLNLGCPSGTVVRKGGGAGMLADPARLDALFDGVFSDPDFPGDGVRLSVKTRLGLRDPEEFDEILAVFNRYPICEIILHPRVQEEYYSGKPHRDLFARTLERTDKPLAYNGDLFTPEDVSGFRRAFPGVKHLMLGRGIVANPALVREICGGPPLTLSEFRTFLREITKEYTAILDNEQQLLLKLKELWYYMGTLFAAEDGVPPERLIRNLRTAKNMGEYRNAMRALFERWPKKT
ncbi:MAG: tRNA-dihydrouridine synthase family protein [Lachnospiraceae bacterium]|nr:tRNA-dihydrouridine synthase family protein [Lachnospiraceae bacterium]